MKLKTTFFLILTLLISSLHLWAQSPVANFNANVVAGCSPLIVDFRDQSTGVITEWAWDFGNGGTSNKQNPSSIYFNPGTYTVTLTVKTASGASNTTTKTAFITVVNEPTVDFITDKTTGCSPSNIKFTDRSSTPAGTTITSWRWDFGDGGSSTQQNPTYSYRTPGSYTVTLSITNDKGCTKLITKPNLINVSLGVKPEIRFTEPDVCSAPATITFSGANSTGPGGLTYSWRLGNGQTSNQVNPTTTYTTNGTYAVTLIVRSTDGCVDSTTRGVTVGKAETDFIVPPTICPKSPVQFLNNSTPRPISAIWQFSNGTSDNRNNGMTTFMSPGTYTVRLINTYTACVDTLVKTVTVLPSPAISFTSADTVKCQPPLTVNFNNTTSGTAYVWDFGDGNTSTQTNPSHTYTSFGNYNVSLIATGTNGCVDTLTKNDFIRIKKPVISFPGLPAKGCIPFKFDFTANVDGVDEVSSYRWEFGDGNTSTDATPSHTYTNQGIYSVTLTIVTSTGCTETFTLRDAVRVGSIPVPDFEAETFDACADPGIQFKNLSTNASQFNWTFSDGSFSSEINPRHVFNDTGWIDVTLTAINNGCEELVTKQAYVYIRPSISRFSYRPDCNNRLVYTFTDNSVSATSWEWDFGDGTTYSGKNPPPHNFPSDGTYQVSLTTSNGGSCTYKLTREIIIEDLTPNFTTNNNEGCKPFRPSLSFTTPNPDLLTDYFWDFGDGVERPATPTAPGRFTYTDAGDYNVRLITVDSFGCRHIATKNDFIRVNGPEPYFNSTNSNGCKGLIATFNDSTQTDGRNSIVNWKWDFGDGTIQSFNAPPFQHQYDSIGDYDVKLVVTDAAGCKDSVTSREFVKISILSVDWNTDGETCPNALISFFDNTTSDLPYTSLWDLGDGNTATARSTSHRYIDTGYYTVKLLVRDILGCEDSLTKTNVVRVGLPQASFTANNFNTYCNPFEGKFTNTSVYAGSYNWDLGGIATSTQRNPSLYFTSPGTYPIKLVATSPGGCKDSVTRNLVVHDPNTATIDYDPLLGCRPFPVNFSAFTQMNGRFIWDFGDGNVVDTSINTYTHLYDNFGAFVPKIVLKEPDGCLTTLTGKETIQINGAKVKFDVTNLLYCDSGYVNIIDSTTARDAIVKYTWNFGDGTISNAQVPVHNYTTPGIYPVSLIVETQTGCKDSLTYKSPVKVVQSPLIGITGDSVICVNERINVNGEFLRTDTSAVGWNWVFGNGNTHNTQSPGPQQYAAGNYSIYAYATNSSGCRDTVQWDIRVNPLPEINVTSPLTKIVGFPITIPVTYSNNIVTYNWQPAMGLTCTDCPQPVTETKFSVDYIISVIDSNNCVNADKVSIIVLCEGAEVFVPNTFSPNGDGRNDVFYPRGRGMERVRSLRIFNRWGEVVFEKREFPVNDPAQGWDGRFKNGSPQPGVYVYQAELICENGEIVLQKGNIALIL